jgi:hypothetical protein
MCGMEINEIGASSRRMYIRDIADIFQMCMCNADIMPNCGCTRSTADIPKLGAMYLILRHIYLIGGIRKWKNSICQ